MKEECTHFYLSILIESTINVFEHMKLAYELISSGFNPLLAHPAIKEKKRYERLKP
jgi:hypothetical protein